MRAISLKLIIGCLVLTFLGTVQAQEASYPSWKHEIQDRLGLEQTGKADRATFDALVSYLTELDMMDETLEKGYDGMGGYLGFQIYLDNNQEWLLDMLRYEEEEGLDDIEEEEDEILEEEDEDFDLDMFGEDDDEDLGFDDAEIDLSDVKKGFAGFGGGGGDALFSLHSIGFDVGMYGPSMSYWNDEFITDNFLHQESTGDQNFTGFAMGPLFQGSTTFKLGSKIRLSLSGGMWSGTAKGENLKVVGEETTIFPDSNGVFSDPDAEATYGVGGTDPLCNETGCNSYTTRVTNNSLVKDITVSMIPLTMIVGYEIFSGFYIGAGMGTNMVTQEITDTWNSPDTPSTDPPITETTEFSGSGSRTILCAGYEMPLGPLAMGLQAQYVLGKYVQEVSDKDFSFDRDNGTDGISFLVTIGYSFGE
jgi:hypothetical protein